MAPTLRALQPQLTPKGTEPPAPVMGKAPRPTAGAAVYDSHLLCHFRVTWETRGAGSLGAPSFRGGVLQGSSV